MKIAFVTPRYGEEVIGGAEHGARMLAERLAAMPDWTVEALSTCARAVRVPGPTGIRAVTATSTV